MKIPKSCTRPALVSALILAFFGCADRTAGDDPLARDSTLLRDLALANADTLAEPQLQDVPVPVPQTEPERPAPAPRTVSRPAPPRRPQPSESRPPIVEAAPREAAVTSSGNTVTEAPPGSEPSLGTISAGAAMSLSASQRVCTNTNSVGDRFTAQLSEPVMGANGAIIPAGATATVEVTALKRSERDGDPLEISLRVISVAFNGRTYPVTSEISYAQVDRIRAESRGDDARKVATGAAIGAVVGQILGRKTRSTVIGAATGAAAGAVVAGVTASYDGCIPSGGRITVRLTEPLVVAVT